MTTQTIETPELKAVKVERPQTTALVAQAQTLVITNDDEYNNSMTIIHQCRDGRKIVEDKLNPTKEAAHKAWKSITALMADMIKPYDDAELIVKDKRNAYRLDQEKARLEAEAAARRQREAEEKRKRDEEAAVLKAAQEAEAEALRKAEEAKAAGDTEKAQAIIDEGIAKVEAMIEQHVEQVPTIPEIPAMIIPNTAPKQEGSAVSWDWELNRNVDMKALCRAVADGKAPLSAIEVKLPALKRWHEANQPAKQAANNGMVGKVVEVCPGVTATLKTKEAIRS